MPLRGSLGTQSDTDTTPPATSIVKKQRAQEAQTGDGTNDLAPPTSGNLADDNSLLPQPPGPPPPLGGLGDESAEAPAVPGPGITDESGEPLIGPPLIDDDDDEEARSLPPKGTSSIHTCRSA
ncbi:MAG: hypothetical protein R3D30_04580 [Hyphomicrobiales bacterium]